MPETSRSFHYWQPAPRGRPLPWLANPDNPAMSPLVEGEKKKAPVTLTKQWKEREGQGRETASKESPRSGKTLTLRKTLTKTPTKVLQCPMDHTRNPGVCAYLTNC